MSPWDTAARWINAILLVVVGFIGFDTLFRLLEANEENVIVDFARSGATLFLGPFTGMFDEQEYLLTALIAVLGYALLAGIALAIIRAVQASIRRRAAARAEHAATGTPLIGGPPRSTGARHAQLRPRSAGFGTPAPQQPEQPGDADEREASSPPGSDEADTSELPGQDPPNR